MPEAQVVVTAFHEQSHRAAREPNRGWPAYEAMYPMGDPALIPVVRFPPKNYRILGADHG